MAAWIQASLVLAVVVGLHVPLGDYMARALDGGKHRRGREPSTASAESIRTRSRPGGTTSPP